MTGFLATSATVAFFLSFASDPLGEGVPDLFFLSDPFIASRFAVLPPDSSGDETSSFDHVFLLLLDRSLSEALRGDFLEGLVVFAQLPLFSPSPPMFDLASILGTAELPPSPLLRPDVVSSPPLLFLAASIGVPFRVGGGTRAPVPK